MFCKTNDEAKFETYRADPVASASGQTKLTASVCAQNLFTAVGEDLLGVRESQPLVKFAEG